jgi:hypothetical protein
MFRDYPFALGVDPHALVALVVLPSKSVAGTYTVAIAYGTVAVGDYQFTVSVFRSMRRALRAHQECGQPTQFTLVVYILASVPQAIQVNSSNPPVPYLSRSSLTSATGKSTYSSRFHSEPVTGSAESWCTKATIRSGTLP